MNVCGAQKATPGVFPQVLSMFFVYFVTGCPHWPGSHQVDQARWPASHRDPHVPGPHDGKASTSSWLSLSSSALLSLSTSS